MNKTKTSPAFLFLSSGSIPPSFCGAGPEPGLTAGEDRIVHLLPLSHCLCLQVLFLTAATWQYSQLANVLKASPTFPGCCALPVSTVSSTLLLIIFLYASTQRAIQTALLFLSLVANFCFWPQPFLGHSASLLLGQELLNPPGDHQMGFGTPESC